MVALAHLKHCPPSLSWKYVWLRGLGSPVRVEFFLQTLTARDWKWKHILIKALTREPEGSAALHVMVESLVLISSPINSPQIRVILCVEPVRLFPSVPLLQSGCWVPSLVKLEAAPINILYRQRVNWVCVILKDVNHSEKPAEKCHQLCSPIVLFTPLWCLSAHCFGKQLAVGRDGAFIS